MYLRPDFPEVFALVCLFAVPTHAGSNHVRNLLGLAEIFNLCSPMASLALQTTCSA